MEIGTAEPLIEPEKRRKSRSRSIISGGSGPAGGKSGGNGGNGGGDKGPSPDSAAIRPETDNGDKAKILTWFLLMVVGMTFAGLIGAFVMVSANRSAEWKPFDPPFEIWVSTFLILASSVTYHIARRFIVADRFAAGRQWLIATTVLGAAFISSQLLVWLELVKRGLYMEGNPFAGFFYILTAAHVIHVLGGIIALGSILLSVWHGGGIEPDRIRRRKLARAVGWYWDFIGAIWVVLCVMLVFWQ